MCTVCGCGAGETKIEGDGHAHEHVHADGSVHSHPHGHDHDHHHAHGVVAAAGQEHSHRHADGTIHSHPHAHQGGHVHDHAHAHGIGGDLDFGAGPARAHAPGLSQSRMVQIEQDILAKNNICADANRRTFDEHGIFALNLVSSPGSGKTTLLVKTIELLRDKVAIAVVEGDQQTSNDAERIRATGAPALQINTGKGCHLDGHMVGHAIERLKPADGSLFLIENVGNLVCPAAFDLGEHHKVVILSVTEGEDKPLKYPDMFRAADVMLLNKCDLLPHLDFDADLAEANARRVNPDLTVFRVSATRGEGMSAWVDWITAGLEAQGARRAESVDALKARIAELERRLAAR
jgi:hydrogenase nickel incorporation protein HypB